MFKKDQAPKRRRNANKQFTYLREKGKVKITGDQDAVKWPMWFDLVTTRFVWIILVVVLLLTIPKASFIPVLWQIIKNSESLSTLFVVVKDFLKMLLSG